MIGATSFSAVDAQSRASAQVATMWVEPSPIFTCLRDVHTATGVADATGWGNVDVSLIKSDGAGSFDEFFEVQFPALAGYCQRLTRDEQVARDIAQESLVRLFSRWRSVRQPRAWVYLVATNLIRDHWSKGKRHDGAMRQLSESAQSSVAGPDHGVRDAVDRLPARLRTTVLLHYFADLPIESVAELTQRPVGTVKQRLHEARGRLATILGASDE